MSIFEQTTRVGDLHQSSRTEGLSRRMVQVRSKYNVKNNWANVSELMYEFSCSNGQYFPPSESFFVIDATLSDAAAPAAALASGANVAWAMNSFSALFSKAQYHLQNQLVSESNHPSREDSVIKRLSHSTAHRNSVGSAQNLQPSQADRKAATIVSLRQEYVYRPECLSIFNSEGLIPQANHRISFQKNSSWQLQSLDCTAAKAVGTDLNSEINDIVFYACVYEGPAMSHDSVLIDLDELKCRVSAASAQENTSYITIEPSTSKIVLAVQPQTLGTGGELPSTRFGNGTDELKISKVRVEYANQSLPSLPYEASAVNDTSRYSLGRMYYDTVNAIAAQDHSAGFESLTTWKDSPLFVLPIVKNNDDRSTNCNVELNFQSTPSVSTNMLLFNQYRKIVQLQYDGGDLQTVSVNEV